MQSRHTVLVLFVPWAADKRIVSSGVGPIDVVTIGSLSAPARPPGGRHRAPEPPAVDEPTNTIPLSDLMSRRLPHILSGRHAASSPDSGQVAPLLVSPEDLTPTEALTIPSPPDVARPDLRSRSSRWRRLLAHVVRPAT